MESISHLSESTETRQQGSQQPDSKDIRQHATSEREDVKADRESNPRHENRLRTR